MLNDNNNINNITTTYREDYTAPAYLVDNIYLKFIVNHKNNTVTVESTTKYFKNQSLTSMENNLILDGKAQLMQIALDGNTITNFKLDNDKLYLNNLPDSFTLSITTLLNPWLDKSGSGLYAADANLLLTQCEPQGFRKITYYLDRPDVMASFTTTIVANNNTFPTLLSNGNKIEEQIVENENTKIMTWHDPFKKPSYLFALVMGNLDVLRDFYITKSGRKVSLEIYTKTQYIPQTKHAMESIKHAFAWDESRFNLEYDLDVYMLVATHNFNMGAMENKGLNIFNAKYVLADPTTATDSDFINIEAVIGHEYFHNWTGNRVTCRDWFQLSLKEGLTVFRDQEFTADMHNRSVKRITDVKMLKARQFTEDDSPLAHSVRPDSYIEINNFYTMTIYEKGAEVVRMYQTIFGTEGFNRGLKLYFARHDGHAATCDDFCNAMMDANHEISSFLNKEQFMLWYSQAGTPLVKISTNYNSATQEYTIECNQLIPDTPEQHQKKPMLIPMQIGLLDNNGYDLISIVNNGNYYEASSTLKVTEGLYVCHQNRLILLLNSTFNKFVIKNVPVKPVPSLFREFSAPIKLDYTYTDSERLFLIQYDSDEYNRFEHLQQLYIKYIKSIYNTMLRLYNDNKNKFDIHNTKYIINELHHHDIIEPIFWNTLKSLLQNPNLSPEFRANLFQLPSFTEMLLQIKETSPEILHIAINQMQWLIGNNLFDSLIEIYNLHLTQKYKFTDLGHRSLKNIALFYILQSLSNKLDNSKSVQLIETMCLGQYHNADNMTDRIAVLQAINNINLQLRDEIFDDFYNKWHNNELVMDKWFTLCASSSLITLDQLNKLMVDKAFDATNPNKIYALLRTFTMNGLRFNSESGYTFIAEQIIAIDKFNPHIASTLANGFSQLNQLHHNYKTIAKSVLNMILRSSNISPDVFEIINKINMDFSK